MQTTRIRAARNRADNGNLEEIWGYPSPWYRVCTKAMIISKASYGYGEPKNVITLSVQKTYGRLRAFKLSGFMQSRIEPTMKIWGNSGLPISIVPNLHQICTKSVIISKGSYWYGEPKNVITLSMQKMYWRLRACELPGFIQRRIRPTMEIWGN